MAFERIQFVRDKQNQEPSRLQNAKTFLQYLTVAIGVFQHFDHGDGIKAFRSERQILSGGLEPWNRLSEGLQVRHLEVHSADVRRSTREFSRIAAVAAAEIQNSHALQVDRLVDLVDPLLTP